MAVHDFRAPSLPARGHCQCRTLTARTVQHSQRPWPSLPSLQHSNQVRCNVTGPHHQSLCMVSALCSTACGCVVVHTDIVGCGSVSHSMSHPCLKPHVPTAGAVAGDLHEQQKLQQQSASLLSPSRRGSFSQHSMDDAAGDHGNMDTGPAAGSTNGSHMFMGIGYPAYQR